MKPCSKTWSVTESSFQQNRMEYYETIFTLGNGYVGVRGVQEEDYRLRTPGTFLAGLFDQAKNEVTELPNLPDWTNIEIELDGERFDLLAGKVLEYERTLDLKSGILHRNVRWSSPVGRTTNLSFRRFVSLADQHLMGLAVEVYPENWHGTVRITSSLNGQVTNHGTQHFACLELNTFDERGIYIIEETLQSGHIVVEAASHRVRGEVTREAFHNWQRKVGYAVEFSAGVGQSCSLEKIVALHSSRDMEYRRRSFDNRVQEVRDAAVACSSGAGVKGFDELFREHERVWEKRWQTADVVIKGDDFAQLAIRFAVFHMIQMTPWDDPRVSVAAKGLSGEGYRGHVFWDTEIFIFPPLLYMFPEVARNLLMYRYITLPGACQKAKDNGYAGAMYPWESADTGEETTPKWGAIDLMTRKPTRIWTGELEQHITADVAYAIWQYYKATGDRDFLINYGIEILCLTARFWASRVTENDAWQYEINQVIGPDEYKEFVNNNFFTNKMAQWNLRTAVEACQLLESWGQYDYVANKLGVDDEELRRWLQIADKIKLPRRGEILVQCDGFFDLEEIDVTSFRKQPGSLHRQFGWERITHSQVLKQADVIMLLYLLADEFTPGEKKANWEFYEPKTVHDSSLSASMHSVVACDLGLREAAYTYFLRAARIDLSDGQGNSDAGLHAAALGGLWQAAVNGFAGVRLENDCLSINPCLPDKWEGLEFHLSYQGNLLLVKVAPGAVSVECEDFVRPVKIKVFGKEWMLDESKRMAPS